MLPVQVCVLILAVLAMVLGRVAQRLCPRSLARASDAAHVGSAAWKRHTATILVCLVGTDAATLHDRAEVIWAAAHNPNRLRFAVVVAVSSPEEIVRQQRDDAWRRRQLRHLTITWKNAVAPDTFLTEGRRLTMAKLHAGEQHVLLVHGCEPLRDWDRLCVEAAAASADEDGAARTVITALPVADADGPGRFPTVRLRSTGARVGSREFAVGDASETTESTVCLRAFSFYPAALLRAVALDDGQLEQTRRLRRHGARLRVPCAPLCVRASRLGVGGRARTAPAAVEARYFGDEPALGIVDRHNTHEIICKYGSVDVARAHVEAARRGRRRPAAAPNARARGPVA